MKINWTKDSIYKEALKYKYKWEWREKSPNSYQAARRQNLVVEISKNLSRKKKVSGPYRWTKDSILKEVKKFNYKNEWREKSPNSFNAAWRLGIRQELSKLLKNKIRKKTVPHVWSDEKVLNEAKKYSTKSEWYNHSPGSYQRASKQNLMEEATKHMRETRVPDGYYNRSRILSISKKYEFTNDWMNNDYNSYAWAIRNYTSKDKEIFGHLKYIKRGITKWTKEKVLEDALKYSTLQEWRRNSGSAEGSARKYGWLKEATKHMEVVGTLFKRCLYSISVKNHKIIYIGLTYRFNRRISDHLKSKRFLDLKKNYGEDCLEIKKLSDYLDVKIAKRLEVKLIDKMRKRNFIILNIAKGGGVGGAAIKWTVEKIKAEGLKYKTRAEWRSKSFGSYQSSQRYPGLYKEITKSMKMLKKLKWTKSEVLADAKKYNNSLDWVKSKGDAAKVAKRDGYWEEATKHMKFVFKKRIWKNKEEILKDAKKYKTRSEWYRSSPGASIKARKDGCYEEATAHMKILQKVYDSNEQIFLEAKKYKTLKQWTNAEGSGGATAAYKRGVYKEVTAHFIDGRSLVSKRYWTEERIMKDAKKYNKREKWSRTPAGQAAVRFKIYEKAVSHMSKWKR
jgi:hypothetical protein